MFVGTFETTFEKGLYKLNIFDFFGQYTCNSETELLQILNNRAKNNSNDFELRHEGPYPYLAMLVNGDKACVHYFLNVNDCGYYASIEDKGLNRDGFTIFHIGSEESGTQVWNRMVIPIEKATIAATAFFHQSKMAPELFWYTL